MSTECFQFYDLILTKQTPNFCLSLETSSIVIMTAKIPEDIRDLGVKKYVVTSALHASRNNFEGGEGVAWKNMCWCAA